MALISYGINPIIVCKPTSSVKDKWKILLLRDYVNALEIKLRWERIIAMCISNCNREGIHTCFLHEIQLPYPDL